MAVIWRVFTDNATAFYVARCLNHRFDPNFDCLSRASESPLFVTNLRCWVLVMRQINFGFEKWAAAFDFYNTRFNWFDKRQFLGLSATDCNGVGFDIGAPPLLFVAEQYGAIH